jgi:hypothetical protein
MLPAVGARIAVCRMAARSSAVSGVPANERVEHRLFISLIVSFIDFLP